MVVSSRLGTLSTAEGQQIPVNKIFLTDPSVTFDGVYVPGGAQSVATLQKSGDAVHYVNEAFKHCMAIAASGEGVNLLASADLAGIDLSAGNGAGGHLQAVQSVLTTRNGGNASELATAFAQAIAQHRHWSRIQKEMMPA